MGSWKCNNCGEEFDLEEIPEECPKCGETDTTFQLVE
jgi:rubrerythrin